MESIRKTAENVEQRFGEALGTRDTTVSTLKKQSGLGPPDMCWLQKRVKKAFRKKSEVRGSYHWVVGLDVRGEASIKAYFIDLVSNLEKVSMSEMTAQSFPDSTISLYKQNALLPEPLKSCC